MVWCHFSDSTKRLLKSILMIPIVSGTGALTVYLARQWNEAFEFGGQLIVGVVAGIAYWLLTREDKEEDNEG